MSEKENVVIIGSGPSGLTAAIYLARASLSPLVYEGTMPGGQLTQTTDIENFPGFKEGLPGFDLMGNMKEQAKRFGARCEMRTVSRIEGEVGNFKLTVGADIVCAKNIILSMGSTPRKLGLPNEDSFYGKGLSTCATCDGAFYRNEDVAIVGGGDSAIEEAIFLTRFVKKVYLIHRRDELRASKVMQDRAMENEKIEVLWSRVPVEILGNSENGTVKGLELKSTKGEADLTINITGLFYAIGHTPNNEICKDIVKCDEQGYVITDEFQRTSVEGIYACGDLQDPHFRQAITAAGSGCAAALTLERSL